MATKKPKTFKKVTTITDAKVTIEVEEKGENPEITEATQEISAANAKIQEENDSTLSIKDEVNSANEAATPETDTESDADSEEAEEAKEDESIVEEANGMSWRRIFLFAFLATCIGIFIIGLVLFVNKNFQVSKKTETKKIELPQETPTPTVEKVSKDAYEIQVLNGSGIAGEAANVEGILQDDGFTVSGIGNADNQNYTNTVIAAKDSVKQGFIDELQSTLESRGSTEVIKLSETGSSSDVVVTVGSNLKEVTPSP